MISNQRHLLTPLLAGSALLFVVVAGHVLGVPPVLAQGSGTIEDLRAKCDAAKRQQAALTEELCKVAVDEERAARERQDAFDLIAEIGGVEGAAFLANRFDVLVQGKVDSDVDMARRWPARVALARMGWLAVPAILKESSAPKLDDGSIGSRAKLLVTVCGRDVALAAVRGHESNAAEWPSNRKRLLKALQ